MERLGPSNVTEVTFRPDKKIFVFSDFVAKIALLSPVCMYMEGRQRRGNWQVAILLREVLRYEVRAGNWRAAKTGRRKLNGGYRAVLG